MKGVSLGRVATTQRLDATRDPTAHVGACDHGNDLGAFIPRLGLGRRLHRMPL